MIWESRATNAPMVKQVLVGSLHLKKAKQKTIVCYKSLETNQLGCK
jgi:hypothetical protein